MKKLLLILTCLFLIIFQSCDNIDTYFSNSQKTLTVKKKEIVGNSENCCDFFFPDSTSRYPRHTSSRNILDIMVNANNMILCNSELSDIQQLTVTINLFLNNNSANPSFSDSPKKAIFLIQSMGLTEIDDLIKQIINREYTKLNISKNEQNVCLMRDSLLHEWRRRKKTPPPPPPPEIIEIVMDEVEIENEIEIEDTESDEDEEIEIEQEDDNDFFMVVENMPKFPGGDLGLMKYIQQNVKYPPIAKEYNITGKVYVSFIVDKSGSVTNVKIVRGVDKNLDAEAMRVVKSLPKYKPGKQKGKFVRVKFTIPINFTLN